MAKPVVPSTPDLLLLGGDKMYFSQVLRWSINLWTMAPRGEGMEQGISGCIALYWTCQNLQLQRDFKMGPKLKVYSVDGPLFSVEQKSSGHVRSRREPTNCGFWKWISNEIQMGNWTSLNIANCEIITCTFWNVWRIAFMCHKLFRVKIIQK